ncbi:42894_t:CDS:2 [Gigaspora margarita]|uniref:42894_t:CDS:1 n=1 Tax=Gigaspora margarita TaxID=4874 RepID=A0ABN7UVQ4_GIGMA|nr:42894_t:CDS:2 [Gigaspora margarita]
MKYPIDIGIVSLYDEEVIPTFSIRNDYTDLYKELIVTDDASAFFLWIYMYGDVGDSGGAVVSFGSPQNLHSVIGHGIIQCGGPGLASAHSLDTIFNELEKSLYVLSFIWRIQGVLKHSTPHDLSLI